MSTKLIVVVVALLVAAGAGGVTYWLAPELFPSERAGIAQSEREAETVARAAEPSATEPAEEIAASEAVSTEHLLVAPSFDIIRVEPTGELLAAGRAAPGAEVELLLHAEPWGTDVTNPDGEWAIIPEDPLAVGEHEVLLRATGAEGEGGLIEGDRAKIVIDAAGDVPVIALARPGEAMRIIQQPEEVAVAPAGEPETVEAAGLEGEAADLVAAAETEAAPAREAAPEAESEAAPEAESEAASETGPAIALLDQEHDELAEQPAPAAEGEVDVAARPEEAEEPAAVEVADEAEAATEPEAKIALREDEAEEPAAVEVAGEPDAATEPEAEFALRQEEAEEPSPVPEGEAELAAVPEPATEPEAEAEIRDEPAEQVAALPPVPEQAEPEPPQLPAMVGIDGVEVTDTDRLILSGQANPGASVRYSLNEEALGEVTADASGAWTATADIELPPGRYVARAEVVGENGEVQASARLRFDRVRIAFAEPAVAEAVEPAVPPAAESPAASEPIPPTEPTIAAADAVAEEAAEEEMPVALAEVEVELAERLTAPAAAEPASDTVAAGVAARDAEPAEAAAEEAVEEAEARVAAAEPVPAAAEPAASEPSSVSLPRLSPEEASSEAELALAPAEGVIAEEPDADPDTVYVQRGDNLWRIARSIYGRGIEYKVIYEANRSQIRNPHLIFPGQVFTIPLPDEADDPA